MKYFLTTFGPLNPFIESELPDHAIYPIGTDTGAFIDLDYSMLLVGTGFSIDKTALEYVIDRARTLSFLDPMAESLTRLKGEGLLEEIDLALLINENRDAIIAKTERLAEDTKTWLRAVRSQWTELEGDRERFSEQYGSPEKKDLNSVHFAVANAIVRSEGRFDISAARSLSKMVLSRRNTFSLSEIELIKEVTKPLIAHVVIQDLVRFKTGSSILDWDDSEEYYQSLYAARWDASEQESKILFEAKSLFSVHIPHLKPKNIDEVIKFIRDEKNVTSLRSDIISALSRGERIDERWVATFLTQVLKSNLSHEKKMRKVRFGGSILGVVIPGGSLATEALIEAGVMGAEESLDEASRPKRRWLYALLE
ncbi:MAG: hypothetical protein AAFQ85_03445 [Pseudomonadota bacterium]